MWTGKIARTERNGSTLDIIVSFTNGKDSEDLTFRTDKAQNDTWLNEQITNRLNQLNGLDVFEQSIKDSKIADSVFEIQPQVIDTPVEASLEVN